MEGTEPTVVDSTTTVETAPSAAVETVDVTHGDTAEQTTTPEAAVDTPDTDDDPENEPSETDSEEEVQTKAQKRRERRHQREQERIDKAVEERLAVREAERETKAKADADEAKGRKALEDWSKEFGSFVGTPEVRSTLAQEIETLTGEIANMRPYAEGTDLDVLEQKQNLLSQKVSDRNRYNANLATYEKLTEFSLQQEKAEWGWASLKLPESMRAAYLQSHTVAEVIERLEAGVTAREQAKADARVKATEAEWKGKYEKEVAAHEFTRTGSAGSGPAPNASNGNGGTGFFTRERLAKMSLDEYRRNKAEIERQELAGLIR